MRVLGVDPGLTRCGIGVIDGGPGLPPRMVEVVVVRTAPGTDLERALIPPVAATRLKRRISTRPRRYDSTDSAPLFSLGRSGCSPSEQRPDSGSTNVVCRSFSPRNQPNARMAPAGHSGPSSARAAARQAEIVAAASTGC